MRALTISAHGDFDQLVVRDDLVVPELAADTDVRVQVRAAALNHLDLFMVRGLPGRPIAAPWILGSDAAGIVHARGSAVRSAEVGDSVLINPGISDGTCEYCRAGEQPLCPRFGILGEHRPGTFAEYVVVPARNVRRIPPPVSMGEAAAFTLATLTAWRMVVTRAHVAAGDLVLIWGIGGGVAIAALRICKARGATVWVASRSADKRERARELGADDALDSNDPELATLIRRRTGKRGVDVVVDNVGAATWSRSLDALGRRGRLVTCGATSGPVVETDVRRLFWNQWSLLGSTMGSESEFAAIGQELDAGRLRPVIDGSYALAEGRSAFERLASGNQFGKVVLEVS